MQTLSDRQLREVTQVVTDHHRALLANFGLGDALEPSELQRLQRKGLIKATNFSKSLEEAYLFGVLADSLAEGKAKNMSYPEFQAWLARKEVPLSKSEREAVKGLKRSMATSLKGLGSRVEERIQSILTDADQNLQRRIAATVKHTLVISQERKRTMGEVVQALQKSTAMYARDWARLVVTELNNAFQEGKLATIQKSNKGTDPWVFKRVQPSACAECKAAYLTKGGAPRLFRLSELLAHGTNVDRPRDDRRATVKSHHPWCQCELQEMPAGFEFDKKGKMQYVGLGS